MFLSSPIQMAVVNKVVSDTQINAISTNGAVVPSSDYAILLSDSLTVDGLAQDVAGNAALLSIARNRSCGSGRIL
ncbi:hypothetical protein EEPDABAO_00092 [Klebsiella phage mfs]|uniref:Uncharacterized protein n=1 Tax=Klebsiella phage mfs TaxID=2985561 RepID=A0A9X9P182_9CAUD|nr:hypothetical protein EEPDABAO_00092 [Klebsiella phage mfs]